MISNYLKYPNWSGKSFITAVFIFAAMAVLYKWSISPHLQYLQAAENYKDTAAKLEKTGKILDAELVENQKKLTEISGQFCQTRRQFFQADSARSFLEGIRSVVEKKGCVVESLKFLPTKEIAIKDNSSIDIEQYQVSLTVSGQYQDIAGLLDFLQTREQRVWVDSINLRLADQKNGRLVCDLSLSIYTLKDKEI